jgi:hypothetical protein
MHPMKLIRRRKGAAVVTLLAALTLAGVATAYWTQGGTGTGSAATGTTVSIVVNQTSAVAGLYPGGPPQALSGNFDNPNPGSVFVAGVTAVVDPTWSPQLDGSKPPCTAGDFVIGGTATVNAQIAPGVGVGSWNGLTISMTNAGTNQDNCKNVTAPLLFSAS